MSLQKLGLNIESITKDRRLLKHRFTKFSMIFHPDKIKERELKKVAKEVFIEILDIYSLHENSFLHSLYILYGNFGLKIYEKYKENFENIESTIKRENPSFTRLIHYHQKEIKQIILYIYFNLYCYKKYWFPLNIEYTINKDQNAKYNNASISLSYSLNLLKSTFLASLAFNGNLYSGFLPGLNFEVVRNFSVLGVETRNSLKLGGNFRQPFLGTSFAYKKFNFNFDYDFVGASKGGVVSYSINDNTVLRVHGKLADDQKILFFSATNVIEVSKKSEIVLKSFFFPHMLKFSPKFKYNFNDEFSFEIKSLFVHSFHHNFSKYYALENFFLGYKSTFGPLLIKFGANFHTNHFDHFVFKIKYYNFFLRIPIITNNDVIFQIGTFVGFAILGGLLYFNSLRRKNEIYKIRYLNKKEIIININYNVKGYFENHEGMITKEVIKETLGDKIKKYNKNENIVIKKCFFSSTIFAHLKEKDFKNNLIPLIDVSKIVNWLYNFKGILNFNDVFQILENIGKKKMEQILENQDFVIFITYVKDGILRKKKLYRNGSTRFKDFSDYLQYDKMIGLLLK